MAAVVDRVASLRLDSAFETFFSREKERRSSGSRTARKSTTVAIADTPPRMIPNRWGKWVVKVVGMAVLTLRPWSYSCNRLNHLPANTRLTVCQAPLSEVARAISPFKSP